MPGRLDRLDRLARLDRLGRVGTALLSVALVVGGVALGRGVTVSLALATDSAASTGSFTAGTWSTAITYYLHNRPTPPTGNTTAQFDLALNTTTPTASTLFNYDTDCDANVGRVLNLSGATCVTANWKTAAFASARTVNGTVSLQVWAKKVSTGSSPHLVGELRDYNPSSGTYTSIAIANVTVSANPGAAWTQYTISWSVNTTLASGHQLDLKLTATGSGGGVQFAYDTTSTSATLALP